MPPRLTIAICFYDRFDLLRACLESVAALKPTVSCDVIVVDNSDTEGGSAEGRRIVEAVAMQAAVPIRTVHARGPNISVARNAAVDASTADFLGFIDDDMQVPPGWPEAVVAAMEATGADVLLGRVDAVPLEGGEIDDPARYFDRVLPLADNAVVAPTAYGHYRGARTSNAVFRRATTFEQGLRFDPTFGRTGGEDTDLFTALHRLKPKIIYSTAAWTREIIPASRQTPHYLQRRALRSSQLFVHVMVKHSRYGMLTGLYHRLVGAAQWLALALKGEGQDPRQRLDRALALSAAIGKMRWSEVRSSTHYH